MSTLVALCGRDRAPLVERCLASLRTAHPGPDVQVVFYLDPLCTQYDEGWIFDQGACETVNKIQLPEGMPPRERVAAMRCAAAHRAVVSGFDRIAFLDSDVLLDPGYFERLDDLWHTAPRSREWGAVTLGNFAGYEVPGYLVARVPELSATIRTHGLGGSLAFPVTEELGEVARRGVPAHASWDSYFCRAVADKRVLTSDLSYVRHLGGQDGLCAQAQPGRSPVHLGLDWHRFTPALM